MEYRFSMREKNQSICLVLSYKVNGKWKQKTKQGFKTKRAARNYQDTLLDAVRQEAETETIKDIQDITLKDFTNEIFLRDKKNTIEYGTRQNYIVMLTRFESIANKPIKSIKEYEVVNAYNLLLDRLKVSTSNLSLAYLKTVLNYAVNTYKIIRVSPAQSVEMAKDKRKKEIKAFTKEEAEQLISSIKNPLYKMITLTAYLTGMRYGEIVALRWSDVDSFNQTITISKSYGLCQNGKFGIKIPKTKNSYRTLHCPARLIKALIQWKESNPIQIDGRVYPATRATHSNLVVEIGRFKNGMNVHSLRHTFATLLLSETQDINLVAACLGDTPATVARTYIHYTQDIRKKANDYIDAIFN